MHEPHSQLPPGVEADLVALADGNLTAVRRLEVEARVAAEPELADALRGQRAALALLATAGAVPMPPELRAHVCALHADRARSRRRLRLWAPAFGAAMAAAAAAIVLLIGSGGPGIDDVLGAALRPATAQASPREQIDGLAFPKYERWRAVGERSDDVGGRATRTVFYERGGRRIAYTIVARPALSGDGAPHLMTVRGRTVVAFRLAGHTCLVSGDLAPAKLLELAREARPRPTAAG